MGESSSHRAGHIAIVGRPSVGKSTLLNALIGAKISITSKKPQTTRYRITGILSESNRQFAFVDTPGFQTRNRSPLNDRLNRTVRDSLNAVDAVVWVVDAQRLTEADRAVAALLPAGVPIIVAIDQFEERGSLRRIHATIYVDKASQRVILLGAAGERMKAIATQARSDMERVFGGPVYLDVWVKVKRGWANDETQLTRFGY